MICPMHIISGIYHRACWPAPWAAESWQCSRQCTTRWHGNW